MHGKVQQMPEWTSKVVRVPVHAKGYEHGYRVAQYVVKGTVAEFERWER